MFKKLFKSENAELTVNYLSRTLIASVVLLSIILVFEIFFLIRILIDGGINEKNSITYILSYAFLAALCLITLIIVIVYKSSNGKNRNTFYIMSYVFFTGVCAVGTFISVLDMGYAHDSMAMVYMTIIMATATAMTIHPIYYTVASTVCFAAIVICPYLMNGSFYSSGLYSNLIVFNIMSVVINRSTYKMHQRDYLSTKKLVESSYRDSLTGLYNRRYFDTKIHELMSDGSTFTFVVTDVDGFKSINDSQGHIAGDMCLTLVARIVSDLFGTDIARYGGDEFVIFSDKSAEEASKLIEKANAELTIKNPNYSLHISAGICEKAKDCSVFEVIRNADTALYIAKASGKCTSHIYSESKSNV